MGADYLEVASFIALAAVTDGEVLIQNASPEPPGHDQLVFERMGVRWETRGRDVFVPRGQSLTVVPDMGDAISRIQDQCMAGFPTTSQASPSPSLPNPPGPCCSTTGCSRPDVFTDKTGRMGARIVLCDPHRCNCARPVMLRASNWKAPTSARDGARHCGVGRTRQSIIRKIGQIDRGYERVDEKIRALGGKIERVEE